MSAHTVGLVPSPVDTGDLTDEAEAVAGAFDVSVRRFADGLPAQRKRRQRPREPVDHRAARGVGYLSRPSNPVTVFVTADCTPAPRLVHASWSTEAVATADAVSVSEHRSLTGRSRTRKSR